MAQRTTPPPSRSGNPWMEAKVDELKAKPGNYEVVRTYSSFSAASVTVARLKALGADATSRKREDGKVDVWAGWIA